GSEKPLQAAIREFEEETGFKPSGKFIELSPLKQKSGKLVFAWATEGSVDAGKVKSNLFEMEWPPRSGKIKQFPEIDKAEWFNVNLAKVKILTGQMEFINELEQKLGF
ncbi:MAG: NUDIX domain-containing protein, partial [Bacteroidetes bacterium]|nr:NUDIX domain-containing protein [Bacteroidota bacterium]